MDSTSSRADLDFHSVPPSQSSGERNWHEQLPVLTGPNVRLRELTSLDAAPLLAMMTPDVTRFISPPPTTIASFEPFVAWAHRERSAGDFACFSVTERDSDTAIGIFQVRRLDAAFDTAEWGFVLGSSFWGTGVFQESAELVLDFVFDTVGAHRLEARSAVMNGRARGALLKIWAVQEGVLRKSFVRDGECYDQALFSILHEDWRAAHETDAESVQWAGNVVDSSSRMHHPARI